MKTKNRLEQLIIDRHSKKGHGVGVLKNTEQKIEIVGAIKGDRVLIELLRRRKGKLSRVIAPSSNRVQMRCKHALECGGCTWQQMAYQTQLEEKTERVFKLFETFEPKFHPIILADFIWHYRNKMEFSFSENKEGTKYLGLMIAKSRGRVINLDECHLTPPWFIKVLKATYKWWEESALQAYHPPSNRGHLRTLIMREGQRTGDKMLMLTVSGNPDYALVEKQIASFKQMLLDTLSGEQNLSIFLRIQQIVKGKPTQFYEMHLHGAPTIREVLLVNDIPLMFDISPTSFFQPNTRQAEKLYARALELIKPTQETTVLDLYAGTATLGLSFAPFVKSVIGIELNPYAVYDAQSNIKLNHITNMEMLLGDVGEKLSQIKTSADLVILDPPRSGLDQKALDHLLRLKPKQILYISCNPITQKDNIEHLSKNNYVLSDIQPVDQFPHTPHIENIALLALRI